VFRPAAGLPRDDARVFERLLRVREPYRLDLTVAVLRRFSTNVVDVLGADGTYRRALSGFAEPAIVAVRQTSASELAVRVDCGPGEEDAAFVTVARMLGAERTLARFDRGAAAIPWLRDIAARMRGVKPPRYPTLWEACVNAVVFQQVSLHAATAILRRVILETGVRRSAADATLYAFPTIPALADAPEGALRTAGLSVNKVATLRRIGEALRTGALDEAMLEERPSPEASALLCGIKGIGPWTAAVVLLRGLGRLDVFPANDSGVARSLLALAAEPVDLEQTFAELGEERGMLYYHLLLARLEARGELATGTIS
jgi:DNA-3-methyladenine glycosylase II